MELIHSKQTVRKTCHERLKELRKKTGYKPAEPKSTDQLTTIHIKTPKKEIKRREKAVNESLKTRIAQLFFTYSERVQVMLAQMPFDEMAEWIINMEQVIDEVSQMEVVEKPEYIPPRRKRVYRDNYFDIPESQDEAYEEYIKDKEFRCASDVVKYRRKFIDKMLKREKKLMKKYGTKGGKKTLNLYDPLFHGIETDLDKVRANMKRLMANNKKRTDQFLEELKKYTGGDCSNIPIVQAFKEKTARIMKQTKEWMDSQGFGSTHLTVEF